MTTCNRYEQEGLARVENGAELEEHFNECPYCLEARRIHERLAEALAQTGADHHPQPGWQQKVWRSIDERSRGSSGGARWPRWIWPAAAVLLFVVAIPRSPSGEPTLATVVESPAAEMRRGQGEAILGDRLVLEARIAEARAYELRVYFNESDLVVRCSSEPPCAWRGELLRAELTLDAIGTYQAVLFTSEASIPAPGGKLDADAGAAIAAGASVELGDLVSVR